MIIIRRIRAKNAIKAHLECSALDSIILTLKILSNALGVSITELGAFDLLPDNTIPEKLTKARLMLGMNKTQFAHFVGVDQSTVRFWERGDHTPHKIRLENLRFLILALGIKL